MSSYFYPFYWKKQKTTIFENTEKSGEKRRVGGPRERWQSDTLKRWRARSWEEKGEPRKVAGKYEVMKGVRGAIRKRRNWRRSGRVDDIICV